MVAVAVNRCMDVQGHRIERSGATIISELFHIRSYMINDIIGSIERQLKGLVSVETLLLVSGCVRSAISSYFDVSEKDLSGNRDLIDKFLSSKRIEGCSEKTINYYSSTICACIEEVGLPIVDIGTDDLRTYLTAYQQSHDVSKVTIDNIRRILSSFLSWLEDEDHILKSPVRRIHKIKTGRNVKTTFSDEELERMRDSASTPRDRAMIDILVSTGMRVGELVNLNRDDVDFNERECIVFGKGDCQRRVYFDAKTKIHLAQYLEERKDPNPALFVSFRGSRRLTINGVECRLKKIGDDADVSNVHPHKFRRTMATMAIEKGMPIEQVQKLLGHVRIDTTLHYAMVNQSNVKLSHRKIVS